VHRAPSAPQTYGQRNDDDGSADDDDGFDAHGEKGARKHYPFIPVAELSCIRAGVMRTLGITLIELARPRHRGGYRMWTRKIPRDGTSNRTSGSTSEASWPATAKHHSGWSVGKRSPDGEITRRAMSDPPAKVRGRLHWARFPCGSAWRFPSVATSGRELAIDPCPGWGEPPVGVSVCAVPLVAIEPVPLEAGVVAAPHPYPARLEGGSSLDIAGA
jgi:hypothetical protein